MQGTYKSELSDDSEDDKKRVSAKSKGRKFSSQFGGDLIKQYQKQIGTQNRKESMQIVLLTQKLPAEKDLKQLSIRLQDHKFLIWIKGSKGPERVNVRYYQDHHGLKLSLNSVFYFSKQTCSQTFMERIVKGRVSMIALFNIPELLQVLHANDYRVVIEEHLHQDQQELKLLQVDYLEPKFIQLFKSVGITNKFHPRKLKPSQVLNSIRQTDKNRIVLIDLDCVSAADQEKGKSTFTELKRLAQKPSVCVFVFTERGRQQISSYLDSQLEDILLISFSSKAFRLNNAWLQLQHLELDRRKLIKAAVKMHCIRRGLIDYFLVFGRSGSQWLFQEFMDFTNLNICYFKRQNSLCVSVGTQKKESLARVFVEDWESVVGLLERMNRKIQGF